MDVKLQVNPRSYASIREAIRGGHVKSRAHLAQQIVEALRKPIVERKKAEKAPEPIKAEVEVPKVEIVAEQEPSTKAKTPTSQKKTSE